MSLVTRTGLFAPPALLLYDAVDHRLEAMMHPELTDERYDLYSRFCRGLLDLATRLLEHHNDTLSLAPAELVRIKAARKVAAQVYTRLQAANLYTSYARFVLEPREARILDEFFQTYY